MADINFSPMLFSDKNKETIQRKAYNVWAKNGYKGTLEIATGVGKTLIGVMAIQQLIPTKKIIIVVPKIDLQEQWIAVLKAQLGEFKSIHTNIGRIGGGYHDFDKPIQICIVNSLRDVENLEADLLIMDEMHRYGSMENFKFLSNGSFTKILGLTATAIRQDGAHESLFQYAPLVFNFTQKEAIEAGILSGFNLTNIMVGLTEEERNEYMKQQLHIRRDFPTFNNDFNAVQQALTGGGVLSGIAGGLMKAFNKRRGVVLNAHNKVVKAVELVVTHELAKVLVFCEYIKTADKIHKKLKESGVSVGKYHSGMSGIEAKQLLQDFKDNKLRVLVTVKSLDEGTDVPDCDTAIIVGGTSVKRQMIQRLGRVLRIAKGKTEANIYQMYIPNTQDYTWMKERFKELVKNAKKVTWTDWNNKVIPAPVDKPVDPNMKLFYAGNRYSLTYRGVIQKVGRERILRPDLDEVGKIVRKHKPEGGVFSINQNKVVIKLSDKYVVEVIK